MAKKKKNKKSSIKKTVKNLSLEQMIARGKGELEAGRYRDALDLLKMADKQAGPSEAVHALLYQAYLRREAQLREKGLIEEADIVRQQAAEYMPPPEQFSPEGLLEYLKTFPLEEAMAGYGRYLAHNGSDGAAEAVLAGQLLCCRQWALLDQVDEETPLRRDAPAVIAAMAPMDQGQWEAAQKALAPIDRESPYAAVRLFCGAMVAFYRENDRRMARALDLIPPDFPLYDLAQTLKSLNRGKEAAQAVRTELPFLWEGPVTAEADMERLIRKAEQGNKLAGAKRLLWNLAQSLDPEAPQQVCFYILSKLGDICQQQGHPPGQWRQLTRSLLDEKSTRLLFRKNELFTLSHKPFSGAGRFIEILEQWFPDPDDRDIAHAQVLVQLVSSLRHADPLTLYAANTDRSGLENYGELLGIESQSRELQLLEIITKALELDPDNRRAYELLTSLPRYSRPAKKRVESALDRMRQHFPRDPLPCLDLARICYEKNAFRQAEKVLKEAMERAPHDNRVIDQHALSLLIAAEKNIRRHKPHLSGPDLEKAESLGSHRMALFVAQKQILFAYISLGRDLETLMREQVDPRPGVEQLRLLSLMILDLQSWDLEESEKGAQQMKLDSKAKNPPDPVHFLKKRFARTLKDANGLGAQELLQLMAPLDDTLAPIYSHRNPAPLFIRADPGILSRIDTESAIPFYPRILTPSIRQPILKDVQGRRKSVRSEKFNQLLAFLEMVLKYLSDKGNAGLLEQLQGLSEEAQGPTREEMRRLSRNLAEHAQGEFAERLEAFDFQIPDLSRQEMIDVILDRIASEEGDAEAPFDENEDFSFDILDILLEHGDRMTKETFEDHLSDLMDEFERFIDSAGLRGVPGFLLTQLRKNMGPDDPFYEEIQEIAKLFQNTRLGTRLSREARILLFGSKKKTRL